MREGEPLVVTDGAQRAVAGQWQEGSVHVTRLLEIPQPQPRVTVVQAIPKSDRAELAVDLMTQAGADRIVPWAASRSIAKWDGKEAKAKAKWENAARAAAKQSRRLLVPEVTDRLLRPADLPTYFDATRSRAVVVLHESARVGLTEVDLTVDEVALVVGPEGGVSDDELEQFQQCGAVAIRLGPEVLRTATAAAVALGALGVLTPRWATATIA